MTTSLGKRSSVNGISDIAYKDEKAPIYTSTDQFVQGTKTFSSPAKFLNNVLCSGSYYGDGSHLTNVTGVDPSKLPLTGGTLTGPLLLPSPNQSIEISEIGIRTSSSNGESKLDSDVLYVHPGQGVRAQLASTSLDFNNDGSGKYVSIGTNTMIGNVDGLLVVNGNTGASAVVGLETASAPIVRLADSASGTETVASLKHSDLKINDVGTGEYVQFDKTQLTYCPPGGAASSTTWSGIISAGSVPNIDQVLTVGNTSDTQLIITDGVSSATMAPSVFNVNNSTSNRFSFLTHGALYFDDALYTGQPFEMGGDAANSPRFHFYSQGGGRGRFSVENVNNPDISHFMNNELGDDRMGVVNNATQSTVYMNSSNLFLSDGGVSAQTTIGNYQIYMLNNSGNSIEINNDALQQWILMYNGSMTANYLANEVNYVDTATSQTVMNYRHYEMSINNAAVDFAFNSTANRFYKWKAAQSFLVDRNDTHIERWHSFKVSEGGVSFSFNAYNDYLDTDGKDGWSVILSNSDGSAIQVTSPDIYFYSHNTGMQVSPFPLNKYATARFTLVELPSYPMGYAWAVSMY